MSICRKTAQQCSQILDAAWVERPGYTAPNPQRYPWQWLWDSCFHAIAWAMLGDRRCVTELESVFSGQLPSGFMPNMLYHNRPRLAWWQWFCSGHSTMTQPPMYGHALKVLQEQGFDGSHLWAPASRAMHHLIDSRLDSATGLLRVVHPWETGCDDSPRWDRWMPLHHYQRKIWNVIKWLFVRTVRVRAGEANSNRLFASCPASFNALVAFNAFELAMLTTDRELERKAQAIARALERTWCPQARTWADVEPGSGRVLSTVPTQEAFLPLLVVRNEQQVESAWAHLMDKNAFLRPSGIAGVSIKHPAYRSAAYWRGGCWPQVCYLLALAARRSKRREYQTIRLSTMRGIAGSNFAEYWNPETGRACGAQPQSWSAILLALL
jgi:hypothetical protein